MPMRTGCYRGGGVLIVIAIICAAPLSGWAEPASGQDVLSFPGAEGFGRFAKGGRGGDVYHVTNLRDAGSGSFREGLRSAKGPRTIVFDLSGTIELKSPLIVETPFITIAGQTAPGDGITLKDHSLVIQKTSHVIVRYLRVRLGDKNKPLGAEDTMAVDNVHDLMLDHITASWGIDGIMDLEYARNVTLQWSIFAEALHKSIHHKGAHAMLSSWRKLKGNVTLHHNLLASSRNRHPTLGSSRETDAEAIVDFRNNVIYNWEGPSNLGNCRIEFVGNDYRAGPNTVRSRLPLAVKADILDVHLARGYLRDNRFEQDAGWTRDNYLAVSYSSQDGDGYGSTTREVFEASTPFVSAPDRPVTQLASEAYERVVSWAGASSPRDAADLRLIAGVRSRTHRRIDSQVEVGGWPALKSLVKSEDRDGDGMADAWEREHGSSPDDPGDGNADRDGDGYTNLEEYLNSLCPVSGAYP